MRCSADSYFNVWFFGYGSMKSNYQYKYNGVSRDVLKTVYFTLNIMIYPTKFIKKMLFQQALEYLTLIKLKIGT